MGCDIHGLVEKYNLSTKIWEEVDGCLLQGQRNYAMFAVLANVRNGLDLTPMTKPCSRGVPVDASEGFQSIIEYWGVDGHSASFVTFDEILDYDWEEANAVHGRRYGWSLSENFLGQVHKMLKKWDCDPNQLRYCFVFDN